MTSLSPGNLFFKMRSRNFLNTLPAWVLYPFCADVFRRGNVTRRARSLIPFILFTFVLSLGAQSAPPTDAPQTAGNAKKEKKQKKEETGAADAGAASFDERDAAEVLGTIRDGLEGHSQRRLLSAFDADKMDGYLSFEDQIEAYFTRYEGFRVTFRIIQTSGENNLGTVLAEFQLENEPRGGGRISRRQGQLRFELERGTKGWKIVDFNPRGFFS
jgi:hypothetical protein